LQFFFRFQYVYATESLQSHNAKATVRRHKHAVAVAVVDAALHLVGDVTPTEYQVMTCRTTMTQRQLSINSAISSLISTHRR